MNKFLIFIAGLFIIMMPSLVMSEVENSDAENLYIGRCVMCHQLPEPTMLNPKQWKLVLSVMQQRMQQAGVPALTELEAETILGYLRSQAD